jgi:HAD superfamily hydrolase (TIGR01484 family)
MKHAKKHLFFDLDDTVTLSRSRIEDEMYVLMKALPHDLVIISGAQSTQIRTQVGDLPVYVLGQNGNEAIAPDGTLLWEERLTDEHAMHINEHISRVRAYTTHEVLNEEDLVEHRGSQISYSLIGHNEHIDKKKAFDPDRVFRQSLLEKEPLISEHVEVKIGGTTCLDYFIKGRHKGFNVKRLIDHMNWNASDAVYYGDALVPGGNDEAVIGVIDTILVQNHRDTYNRLRKL